jgi:hypothetical protein
VDHKKGMAKLRCVLVCLYIILGQYNLFVRVLINVFLNTITGVQCKTIYCQKSLGQHAEVFLNIYLIFLLFKTLFLIQNLLLLCLLSVWFMKITVRG